MLGLVPVRIMSVLFGFIFSEFCLNQQSMVVNVP